MTVGSGVGLEADPGEDPEPVQQGLQAAHQILPDHVHFHHGRTCPCGDEALGLENAAQVGGARPAEPRRAARELPCPRPGAKVPPIYEVGQRTAVKPDALAVQLLALGREVAHLSVYIWENGVQRTLNPGELSRGYRECLHRQRPVSAGVLTDEPVGLHPSRQRSFCDVELADLGLPERCAPMPLQHVAGATHRRRRNGPNARGLFHTR